MKYLIEFENFNESVSDKYSEKGMKKLSDNEVEKMTRNIQHYGKNIHERALKELKRRKKNENFETETTVDDQIYNTIEMMMRPGEDTLSYDEINDIANENSVDEEHVLWIMQRYLADRNDSNKDELKDAVKDCLDYLKNEEVVDIEEISWVEFKNWFESSWISELVLSHTDEEIKKEFENQTKDPNQLKLPLEEKIKLRDYQKDILNKFPK